MIKEAIEKEAEKKGGAYVDKLETMYGNMDDTSYTGYQVIKAYEQGALDFALPREKRIAELEAQIEKMKCCEICSHNKGGCSYHHNWTKDCLENNHKYFELKEIKEK